MKEIAWWNKTVFTEAFMHTCGIGLRDNASSRFRGRPKLLAATSSASQEQSPFRHPALPFPAVLCHLALWVFLTTAAGPCSLASALAITSAWDLLLPRCPGVQLLLLQVSASVPLPLRLRSLTYLQYYPPSCSHLVKGGIHPLPPELVWMSKLITVHAPGEYEKFSPHIRWLSEEGRAGTQGRSIWLEWRKWCLWVFLWLGCGARKRLPQAGLWFTDDFFKEK